MGAHNPVIVKPLIDKISHKENIILRTSETSMLPLLQDDDILYAKKVVANNIHTNDLLILKNKNSFITRRVIYKTNKYLISRGDNNLNSDGKINLNRVLGRVYQVKRNNQVFEPETLYLVQSTTYFKQITKIVELFEKNKVNYVFLKGLPLHLYFEKAHPRRIYLDCDVLINKDKFKQTEKILLNFRYKFMDVSLSNVHNLLREKIIENSFYKIINDLFVVFDIHLEIDWMSPQLGKLEALYPQSLIDKLTENFLKNKKVVTVCGKSFSILSNENLIVYLALHFFHHNFRGAFRLEFLDKVIRKTSQKEVVFRQVSTVVNKLLLQNFVYPAFLLLKKYYQTPLPRYFLKSIKPVNPFALNLGSRIYRQGSVFDDEPRIQEGITRFKNLFFFLPDPGG